MTNKWYYSYVLKRETLSVKPDLKIISKLIKKGDVVLDIGANYGTFTKFLSESVSKNGKVYCIEPIPKTFKILQHCIKKLKLTNSIPLNYAVSDKNGVVTMQIPKWKQKGLIQGQPNPYRARIMNKKNRKDDLQTIHVKSRSIDSLFKDIKNISFIKMDVECHELPSLKGGKKTLEKSKPNCIIEVVNDKAFKFMEKLGYNSYWFDIRYNKLRKTKKGVKGIPDYLFVHPTNPLQKLIPSFLE